MSGEHTPGRLRPRRLTTLQWAQERIANTQRLAATKSGTDRDGWLEDGAYWKDIVSIIAAAPETAAERDRLRAEIKELTGVLAATQNIARAQMDAAYALRAEKAELVAALRRLLATTNVANAEDHRKHCKCVICEARAALAKCGGEQ